MTGSSKPEKHFACVPRRRLEPTKSYMPKMRAQPSFLFIAEAFVVVWVFPLPPEGTGAAWMTRMSRVRGHRPSPGGGKSVDDAQREKVCVLNLSHEKTFRKEKKDTSEYLMYCAFSNRGPYPDLSQLPFLLTRKNTPWQPSTFTVQGQGMS